jgi:hypothetical protein
MESIYAKESAETGHAGERLNTSIKPKPKKTVAARAKSDAKVPPRTSRSSRAKSTEGDLVCRYCGSADLAPSFKKRRDARCRSLLQEALWLKDKRPTNRANHRKAKVAK